ncbi:MAG TPA: hypothetical protein VI488_13140 [Candidatus Angelobacter sp.]
MRELWPPTYDDFSVRGWAAALSGSVNLILGLLLYLHRVGFELLFLYLPGFFAYMFVYSLANHGIEVASVSRLGLVAAVIANFALYYFVAWWLIRAFRPATNWWPAKHS